MKIFNKILSVTLCLLLIACAFCGCGEKYKDAIIYFELLERPTTLDPQTAQSDSELLIVRNLYEGLFRKDKDGKIIKGVCESYSYKDLTYTFKLKDDAVWSNGNAVTAYDFEYAFYRAVDPKIKAPFVSRLFAIKNAEEISNGNAAVSTLGVKAVDATTLTISMGYEDENFLKTLTTSICMPCNEKFFEDSIGKYGLDAECILSNGSYRLTKWNKEDFGIRIYKNEEYNGISPAQNAAVFISCIEDETQLSRLSGNESDMALVAGKELNDIKDTKLTTKTVQNICWIMTISRNYSLEVRQSFAKAFATDIYKNALPIDFSAATSIYPETLGINADNVGLVPYNIDEAKSIMSAEIAKMQDKKFPQSTLYYYDDGGVKELATAIVGHWQQNLGAFVNIEASDNIDALMLEIDNETLDFALFPVTAKSGYFEEYSKIFAPRSSAITPDALQQELFADYSILPVAHQTTNIVYMTALENVIIDSDNGYIDFSSVIKK